MGSGVSSPAVPAFLDRKNTMILAGDHWSERKWSEMHNNGLISRDQWLDAASSKAASTPTLPGSETPAVEDGCACDSEDTSAAENRNDLLPAWMLDLKLQMRSFSHTISLSQNHMTSLNSSMTELQASQDNQFGKTIVEEGKEEDEEEEEKVIMKLLPDVLGIIFSFLEQTEDCVNFTQSCTSLYSLGEQDMAWEEHAAERWSIKSSSALDSGWRALSLAHGKALMGALNAMTKIQNERRMRRTQDPKPHRYLQNEKEVSHPMPLPDGQHMMSHCHTMTNESRTMTMKALRQLLYVTENGEDNQSMRKLLGAGAVTVLVALLCNESQAMQELACAALGNLFCSRNDEDGRDRAEKARQDCRMCSGLGHLAKKLASPLSSVDNSSPSTTYMGLATQQAARAMCNLLISGICISGSYGFDPTQFVMPSKSFGSVNDSSSGGGGWAEAKHSAVGGAVGATVQRINQQNMQRHHQKVCRMKRENATKRQRQAAAAHGGKERSMELWVALSQQSHGLQISGLVSPTIGMLGDIGFGRGAVDDGRVLWQFTSHFQNGEMKEDGIIQFRFHSNGEIEVSTAAILCLLLPCLRHPISLSVNIFVRALRRVLALTP
jgi:hypothetical protein